MKKTFCIVVALWASLLSSWAVTVNQTAGAGDYTSIQAAIDSGASEIIITDSGHYVENLQIGDLIFGGPPVKLTSTKSGSERPVITPSATKIYTNSRRVNQGAGFGVFANDSTISNLIIEAQPDLALGAMMVTGTNVLIESCVLRIAPGTLARLAAMNSLIFFAQQGDGSNLLTPGLNPTPDGQDANACLVRNCEFAGVPPDANPVEPEEGKTGYLGGQSSGYARMDHLSDGRDVTVTFDGCYFHHSFDYGIFPSNNRDGAGSINVVCKKCRFDANGKFHLRGRGANVFAEDCIFTRNNQTRNGDGENSAVAVQRQDAHYASGGIKNCLFVNCGSANAQQGYFGGANNNDGDTLTVEKSTFVDCVNGVVAGTGSRVDGGVSTLSVSGSIFHNIGNNVPPSVNKDGITLLPSNPDLIDGEYIACTNGLVNFGGNKFSAVFNRFRPANSKIVIDNCLVGVVSLEDTRTWEEALAANEVTGCRLFAGTDDQFDGAGGVARAVPSFVNTDPDSLNPYQLTADSPGQGLGADLAPVLTPTLGLTRAGNDLTITFSLPIWVKGYALKSTSDLNSPVWTTVPGSEDGNVTITIGATGSQFFALLKE